jgi:hypothetical protein
MPKKRKVGQHGLVPPCIFIRFGVLKTAGYFAKRSTMNSELSATLNIGRYGFCC